VSVAVGITRYNSPCC